MCKNQYLGTVKAYVKYLNSPNLNNEKCVKKAYTNQKVLLEKHMGNTEIDVP